MGRDIHVKIIKRDHTTDKWKQIKFYKKEKRKFKVIDVYPFRNYELFDIISEKAKTHILSLIIRIIFFNTITS